MAPRNTISRLTSRIDELTSGSLRLRRLDKLPGMAAAHSHLACPTAIVNALSMWCGACS